MFVRDVIRVWSNDSRLLALARVVEADAETLAAGVAEILSGPGKNLRKKMDQARSFLVRHAIERVRGGVGTESFVLFRDRETVEVILEDCFGVEPGIDSDCPVFPHQEEIVRMIARCMFPKRGKVLDVEDLLAFLRLLTDRREEGDSESDRAMRFKTLVWLGYLLLDLIRVDRLRMCEGGLSAIRARLRQLLDAAVDGAIIDESVGSARYHLDGGKWDRTLFGWLQGDDRRPLVLRLVRQLNFENIQEHSSRMLLAEHRECMYRQALHWFC